MSKEFIACLDAGHGFNTPGKRSPASLGEVYKEHRLNSRVLLYVKHELSRRGINYIVTTSYNLKDISLRQRCNIANKNSADLFISIHHNAGANLTKASGVVVYYYPACDNKELATLLYNDSIRVGGLRGNRANPIKANKTFTVLKKTKCPAFLLECGFMDSTVDYPIITSESYAYSMGVAIADFVEHFKERKGL